MPVYIQEPDMDIPSAVSSPIAGLPSSSELSILIIAPFCIYKREPSVKSVPFLNTTPVLTYITLLLIAVLIVTSEVAILMVPF